MRTFGGFEVTVAGEPVVFRRAKAKELLALLVDRRGASLTTREVCAFLWPQSAYGARQRGYSQVIVSSLRSTLEAAGCASVLVKRWNSLAVDPSALECDCYLVLDGLPCTWSHYRHDYLPAYEWSEGTSAALDWMAYGRD